MIGDQRWTIYRRHGQTTSSFPVESLMTWKWPVVNRQVQESKTRLRSRVFMAIVGIGG